MSHEIHEIPPLRMAGFVRASRVNGPGLRAVLWAQGCTIGCKACFNPQTHPPEAEPTSIEGLVARLLAARTPGHAGFTLSGGEPFQQAEGFAALCRAVRAAWPEASVMAFSGYTLEALRGRDAPRGAGALLDALDLLVDGPFEAAAPTQRPWRASAGQRLWVLGRLPPLLDGPSAKLSEIHVEPDGRVLLSGFPEPALRRAIAELAR